MTKNIKLTMEARGKTEEDLVLALEEVIRGIKEGYLSGHDSNDDGEYGFDIEVETL